MFISKKTHEAILKRVEDRLARVRTQSEENIAGLTEQLSDAHDSLQVALAHVAKLEGKATAKVRSSRVVKKARAATTAVAKPAAVAKKKAAPKPPA